MEIFAGFRPQPAQDFLARSRHWIDTHTEQVIIIVSLVLGFWLIATSIYYIVTQRSVRAGVWFVFARWMLAGISRRPRCRQRTFGARAGVSFLGAAPN